MALFDKKAKVSSKTPSLIELPPIVLKYPKPKVMLLDVPAPASQAVIEAGFNVSTGTFGTPYRVQKEDTYLPVIGQAELPNYMEQEIIVVDLHIEKFADGPDGLKHRPDGEEDLWAKCDRGVIDPRPRTALRVCESFNRILSSGGVFVVFADARTGIELILARKQSGQYGRLYNQHDFNRDVWFFLDELSDMTVIDNVGHEMRSTENKSPLGRLVAEHLAGGEFLCTLEGGYRHEDEWVTLAENKFGDAVSVCRCRGQKGSVIVLPLISDKSSFLTKLFANVLPEIAPHLFPDLERGKWTHRPEYELTRITDLRKEQTEVEQRAKSEIAALEIEIQKERTTNGWLHDLLTGTDAGLVKAVKMTLSVLGFSKVVDVDEERDREGKSRREDLQIEDKSPTLIVDIKGIGGFPSDEDALQADKHAAIRMREQERTNIIGLSIINHQRHLPPLERENTLPFRQELIDAAEERSLGLMTTWDLYRLVRNSRKFAWNLDYVKPLFYKKGRIDVVPEHYQFIGKIAKAWTDKFGVVIEHGELGIGEIIAVEFLIEFEEVRVDSIRVNDQNVKKAKIGDPAGLLWPSGAPKLREGMRVFRISTHL